MNKNLSTTARSLIKFQQGAVLVVAIIMLLVMAIFAFSAIRFTNLERKMGSNEEHRITAFQSAQSVADAITSNPANTIVAGASKICTASARLANCSATSTITIPDAYLASLVATGDVSASVELTGNPPPPRSASRGSSLTNFAAASFTVTGNYDRSGAGLGQEQISQGLILIFPKY